jgi:hypothetical protein
MEGVRARAEVRQLQTEAYVDLAATVLAGLKTKLEDASTSSSQAYRRYASVIAEGAAAAKSEEELLDIGVGILLAVGTGVGAAAGALEVGAGLAIEATKEAKVLDRDPIEKHLAGLGLICSYYGSGGSLGVDTGVWTAQADCLKMIEAAKGRAGELKAEYGSVTE